VTKHVVTTLGDICEFRYGKPLPADARRGGRVAVYGSNGVVGHHDEPMVVGPSIVIGRKGSFGEVHYAPTDSWPIDTTYFIDASATKADLKWLSYALQASRIKDLNKSAAVPGLNRNDAYRLPIVFPPLDEQRRIAAILDKADALRAKRKRAIALLDSLTQSIFLEMFGGLKGEDYERVELQNVTRQITDGAHFTPSYVDEGVPFLRVTDIHGGPIDWLNVKRIPRSEHEELLKRCRPELGDVLLSKNGTIGIPRVVDWTEEFSIFVSLALLKPEKRLVTSNFLYSFLKSALASQQLRQQSKTGTVTNLHLVDIRKLKLPLPPMTLQHEWDRRTQEWARISGRQSNAHLRIETLFSSLQHRAFSGQL